MELRHLRYFVAVAEELNFSRAAARLHISQPPLSTQIRQLEEELGAQLFERDRRHVSLTQAGRFFQGHARAMLAAAEQARIEVRSAAAGQFARLGVGYTASAMFTALLPKLIRIHTAQHPSVALELRELSSSAQLHALLDESIDIGILRKPEASTPRGVLLEQWLITPFVVALPQDHALAKQRAIAIARLRQESFICYPQDSGIGIYWRVLELCRAAGFKPRIVREVRESSTIVGLVAAGVGVALLPADTRCIRLEGVVFKRLTDREAAATLYLAHRAAEKDQHAQALLEALRAGATVVR